MIGAIIKDRHARIIIVRPEIILTRRPDTFLQTVSPDLIPLTVRRRTYIFRQQFSILLRKTQLRLGQFLVAPQRLSHLLTVRSLGAQNC
jgi:hypothetical protein